ncbi:hypothetical protein NPX79_01810 [Spiroplasma endosymbiont of Anurida maritima]|uniref:hypothetical protein n=1 Tax=Spiroplasma endosymbiont of Anurida maritima TaxID=2967972 RepID=UPI0036D3BD1E
MHCILCKTEINNNNKIVEAKPVFKRSFFISKNVGPMHNECYIGSKKLTRIANLLYIPFTFFLFLGFVFVILFFTNYDTNNIRIIFLP